MTQKEQPKPIDPKRPPRDVREQPAPNPNGEQDVIPLPPPPEEDRREAARKVNRVPPSRQKGD